MTDKRRHFATNIRRKDSVRRIRIGDVTVTIRFKNGQRVGVQVDHPEAVPVVLEKRTRVDTPAAQT